ncbi:MAG: hypothetical protein PHE54_04245 [Bacilli bacterium]|nr:hypothetical protein [Bacilli bacterium]
MKKILLLLLLLSISICSVKSVKADNYYSDYGSFSEYQETLIEESDTVDVETERRFKWYKEEKELGDYALLGDNDPMYPYADVSDYIQTSFTSFNVTYPKEHFDRNIETRTIYKYQDMKEIRYLKFSNVSGSYGSFRISELMITAGLNTLNYAVSCSSCSEDFDYYINNGSTYESMAYVNNGGTFVIDLLDYYPLDSLNITLYMYDEGYSDKRYNLEVYRTLTSNVYAEVLNIHYFTYNGLDEIVPFNINVDKLKITNPEWYPVQETTNYVEASKTKKVTSETQYRYQDKLYRYYRLNKVYNDVYSSSGIDDFNLCDVNDYLDFYRYRSRDKVTITDNLIIVNDNTKLEDFITYSSVDEINIISDINYEVNGTYNVSYELPFITINKNVMVNIEQNTIDYYQEIINGLEAELTLFKIDNENLNDSYNLLQDELESLVITYQNELTIYQENLLAVQKQLEDTVKNNSSNQELITKYLKEIDNLETIVNEKKTIINQMQNDMIEITNDLNNKINEIGNLENTINQNKSNYNTNINALQEEINKYKAINASYIEKIDECQDKLFTAKNAASSLNEQLENLSDNQNIKTAGINNIYIISLFSILFLIIIIKQIIKKYKKSN